MKRHVLAALAAGVAVGASAQPIPVDPALPSYQEVPDVSGHINSVGSDTMNNLMTLWSEAFMRMYPGVKVRVESKGSSTAPPALVEGTAQIGPMSRAMRPGEIEAFEGRYGYEPTPLRTAYDALAVYVNKDNPIERLTLAQVDAIFSRSCRRGAKPVRTWGDLGLAGEWAAHPIVLYGRNSASGTWGLFKEHVLENGDYRDEVREQPGSASVVQGVTEDRYGIGYSGIGYRTPGVKAVALAERDGGPYSSGSYEDVRTDRYPLHRFLYLYVNKAPRGPLAPQVREFCRLVFSRQGQEVVVADGYLPLPAEIVMAELRRLD
jgi:phosphate transport system substrate-binding protein